MCFQVPSSALVCRSPGFTSSLQALVSTSAQPWYVISQALLGSLVHLAPPWSIHTLTLPRTSRSPATPRSYTPPAPPAPPSLRFRHCPQSHRLCPSLPSPHLHLGSSSLQLRLGPLDIWCHTRSSSPQIHLALFLSWLHLSQSGSWLHSGSYVHWFCRRPSS